MFGKKPMSDLEKKAKLAALKDAHGTASDMMKDSLSGMKKVTVASDSKEGLKHGLDKAEDMLGSQEMSGEGLEMSPEECRPDEMEHMEKHESEMSEEELDAKIQELLELKDKLQAGEE